MRKQIIIGNWKMNKNVNEAIQFLTDLNEKKINLKTNLICGIATPNIYLVIGQTLNKNNVLTIAQDVSQYDVGAFTGDVSASMLKEINIKYVIVGHSERRKYHHETNEIINQKAIKALENSITPIICVGETLEEYENGKSIDVIKTQVQECLKNINSTKVVIAYEPIWAIGTGKTATAEYAQKICSLIRSLTSEKTLIQYGGSVTENNIEELLSQKDIDGALVGGASLKLESFIELISQKKLLN